MKKIYSLVAMATMAGFMASCVNDEGPESALTQGSAIEFSMKNVNASRGADLDAATSAARLGNKFIVNGQKTIAGTPDVVSTVFDNKEVEYSVLTADAWDYAGVVYWDATATSYSFHAYSDQNDPSILALAANPYTGGATTSEVTAAELSKLHVAPVITAGTGDFNKTVKFKFKNAAAKVRVALFNDIAGYNVEVTDFTMGGTFYGDASYNILADGTQTFASSSTPLTTITLGTDMIGSISNDGAAPTYDNSEVYTWVLPTLSAGSTITFTVSYTTTSTSTSEVTTYTDKEVTVSAAEFTQWQPNHAYTYVFKFTNDDMKPIVFDAVVEEFDEVVPTAGDEFEIH